MSTSCHNSPFRSIAGNWGTPERLQVKFSCSTHLYLKESSLRSSILYRINSVLSRVVAGVSIGTNLGLFSLLWMLLSGRLFQSRGAVIPGLADLGLATDAVRRCWAALAYGTWHASQLLGAWEQLVREEGCFQAHQYGGYRPVACDLVGFFRPRLQDCPTKPYSAAAGKALPGIPVGIAARVGRCAASGRALPPGTERGDRCERSHLANPPTSPGPGEAGR